APTCLLSLRLARRRRSCAPAMFAGTPTRATSIRRERMSPFTRTTGVGGLTSASRARRQLLLSLLSPALVVFIDPDAACLLAVSLSLRICDRCKLGGRGGRR